MVQDERLRMHEFFLVVAVFIIKCIRNIYGDGRGLFVGWNLNMCVFLYADYVSLVEKPNYLQQLLNGLHDTTCDLN